MLQRRTASIFVASVSSALAAEASTLVRILQRKTLRPVLKMVFLRSAFPRSSLNPKSVRRNTLPSRVDNPRYPLTYPKKGGTGNPVPPFCWSKYWFLY